MNATNYYHAYARLRLSVQQAVDAQSSVRFFRRSLDHSRIWMLIIEGHYAGNAPSVQQCIDAVRCSRMTARRIMEDAESQGFIAIVNDSGSKRRKAVVPTRLCVEQYEVVVDRHRYAWDLPVDKSNI